MPVRSTSSPSLALLVAVVALTMHAACGDADPTSVDSRDVGAGGTDGGPADAAPDGGDDTIDAGNDTSDAGDDIGDAGEIDAGAHDGGPWDSGPRDSGPRDSEPRDSGPRDSGPRDSGPRDSGPRDSGDSSRPDSGPPDSGPRDSGPRDSGPRDSGPRDSGPRDSGPWDSGPSDAGVVDAGSIDAGPDGGIVPITLIGPWGAPLVYIGSLVPGLSTGDAPGLGSYTFYVTAGAYVDIGGGLVAGHCFAHATDELCGGQPGGWSCYADPAGSSGCQAWNVTAPITFIRTEWYVGSVSLCGPPPTQCPPQLVCGRHGTYNCGFCPTGTVCSQDGPLDSACIAIPPGACP